MTSYYNQDILLFLKALADDSRLTLLRLLNEKESTVSDLAQQINLTEPTVSHHLTRLREAGLVSLRMDGTQHYYRVHAGGVARFKRLAGQIEKLVVLTKPEPPDNSWIATLGWSEEDQQILRDYTSGPHLTHLPNKRRKTEVILRWLVTLFQAGRMYSEAEVNEVLKSVYAEDYVSLRRDMVDFRFLRRESGGSKYWLASENENAEKQ
jgi:predicted transcriptional regulator